MRKLGIIISIVQTVKLRPRKVRCDPGLVLGGARIFKPPDPMPMQVDIYETWVWSLGQEEPLEEKVATNSSILAWEIPRTEEPSGQQSKRLHRVGHD